MIIDQNLVLSDNQSLVGTGLKKSKVIELNGEVNEMGRPVPINVQLTETVKGATSITFKLVTCDTKDGTFKEVLSNKVMDADLKLGAKPISGYLPQTLKKFIRVDYVIEGNSNSGSVFANLGIY